MPILEIDALLGKFLDIPGIRRNSAPSSHIHGGLHHEFNKWTPL